VSLNFSETLAHGRVCGRAEVRDVPTKPSDGETVGLVELHLELGESWCGGATPRPRARRPVLCPASRWSGRTGVARSPSTRRCPTSARRSRRRLRHLGRAAVDQLGVAVEVPLEKRTDVVIAVGDVAVHRHHVCITTVLITPPLIRAFGDTVAFMITRSYQYSSTDRCDVLKLTVDQHTGSGARLRAAHNAWGAGAACGAIGHRKDWSFAARWSAASGA
jgi:hypothetical protein